MCDKNRETRFWIWGWWRLCSSEQSGSKKDVVWKCDKCFEKSALEKCSLAEKGIVNNNLENLLPLQVFTEAIDLDRLLALIKVESERYAAQNGRVFQTTNDELAAFLGINILMGILGDISKHAFCW